MFELTVILKDDEKSFRQKFLCYETVTIDPKDPYIVKCIEEAKSLAKFEPEDITIKISMSL